MEATEDNKHPEGIDVADGHREKSEENAGQNPAANQNAADGAANAGASNPDAEAEATEATAEAKPESELERAQREIDELKDSWNRERADFANFRKRTVQERARAQGEAVARFTRELLDVMDNLDRVLSIKSDNPEVQNFVTGVEMIRSSFVGVFQNHSIKVSNPLNEAFDPGTMEAIAREDRPDLTSDTVIEVYQSGYTIDLGQGEVQSLRPARVKVGVAPKGEKGEKGEKAAAVETQATPEAAESPDPEAGDTTE
ncbi:MAG: nucleotide exchange factor GrpE [bacterium]|nr:nucleotide exchange factor GrpE [bacterium]